MILHVHKELTDSIKLEEIANEFVGDSHHRVKVFGSFNNLTACITPFDSTFQ